jgi:hypothetical protein
MVHFLNGKADLCRKNFQTIEILRIFWRVTCHYLFKKTVRRANWRRRVISANTIGCGEGEQQIATLCLYVTLNKKLLQTEEEF